MKSIPETISHMRKLEEEIVFCPSINRLTNAEQFIEPVITNRSFTGSSQMDFTRYMNLLHSASGNDYVCELLGVILDSREFITHNYEEILLEDLQSFSDETKLKLVFQILKLIQFLESIGIMNTKISVPGFYIYRLSDSDIKIKFWDFSNSYYSANNENFDNSETIKSLIKLILSLFPPSLYQNRSLDNDVPENLLSYLNSINASEIEERIRLSLNISNFISLISLLDRQENYEKTNIIKKLTEILMIIR